MEKLKSACSWLKQWSWALLLGLLALAGAGWAIRRRQIQLGQVRDALAVERAQNAIAELRGKRDQLLTEVTADHALVQEIDAQLAENKRKLVEAHEMPPDMTTEEVADAFRRLGY